MARKTQLLRVGVLLTVIGVTSVFAASSASFVFDFVSDPGDVGDGPDYDVTGIGVIDDGGGCDLVVMVMVDATGAPTDVDSFCLSLITGLGGSDGDYGSFGTGYVPTLDPVTYALFDLTAADIAALSGFGDNDQEYFDYVVANTVCLAEQSINAGSIPVGTAYSLCGSGSVGGTCRLSPPAGSVVGEAPVGAQVYWSPGNASPGIVLNPGTYIVVGQDASETYYKVVLACEYVWVRKDTMQPSFQSPQNGAPLPTTIVS